MPGVWNSLQGHHIMVHILRNKPMTVEVFRMAFYLYGRPRVIGAAFLRMLKSSEGLSDAQKRTLQPDPHPIWPTG